MQTRWVFVNPDESYLTKVSTARASTALPQTRVLTHRRSWSHGGSPHAASMRALSSKGLEGCRSYGRTEDQDKEALPQLQVPTGAGACAQAQEISLNFHCKCEQFVHFATGSFFNFNGTAGGAFLSSAWAWPCMLPMIGIESGILGAHSIPSPTSCIALMSGWQSRAAVGLQTLKPLTLNLNPMPECVGVWRRKTIQTVGGWQSRTTVGHGP